MVNYELEDFFPFFIILELIAQKIHLTESYTTKQSNTVRICVKNDFAPSRESIQSYSIRFNIAFHTTHSPPRLLKKFQADKNIDRCLGNMQRSLDL